MVAQHCEYTLSHLIVHFQMVKMANFCYTFPQLQKINNVLYPQTTESYTLNGWIITP